MPCRVPPSALQAAQRASDRRLIAVCEPLDAAALARIVVVPRQVGLFANQYTGTRQATALGALGSVRAGAGVLAFLIGGILGSSIGWRPSFGILIVLVPGYETIGLFAPAIVLIGRLLQGFSAGAEMGGVSVYLSEIATPGNKGFFTSWQSASQQVAIIVAAALGFGLNQWVAPAMVAD